jgi:hypothetical protein
MDMWEYQNHIRETKTVSLSNTPYQEMMQPLCLDHIKRGAPNTEQQQHPLPCYQTIKCRIHSINRGQIPDCPSLMWPTQTAICQESIDIKLTLCIKQDSLVIS